MSGTDDKVAFEDFVLKALTDFASYSLIVLVPINLRCIRVSCCFLDVSDFGCGAKIANLAGGQVVFPEILSLTLMCSSAFSSNMRGSTHDGRGDYSQLLLREDVKESDGLA
jgi:hypothetical protein